MTKIAVVEDQKTDSDLLCNYITQYAKEHNCSLEVTVYSNGLNFLDEYTANYNVVFMDIEMPHLDGIETARKLRDIDPSVALVFVTNMIQYAINGYEVNAIDFMVKPVGYYNFSLKLEKALNSIEQKQIRYLTVRKDGAIIKVPIHDIYYIEKDKNYVVIHVKQEVYHLRTSVSEVEEKLSPYGFVKCYIGCLVNLSHVEVVQADRISIGGEWLPLSRRNKKEFMTRFADQLGGLGL